MSTENNQAEGEPIEGSDSELQSAQAIEDRLAKGFEQAEPVKAKQPDKPDETPDGNQDEGDGLEEVEYEGETFKVPPKLKEAIIHKADYTRKTQEVAERTRQIELQNEQLRVAHLEQEFQRSVSDQVRTLGLIETRQQLLIDNWNTISADEKQEILLLDKQREKVQRDIDGKRGEFNEGLKKSMYELQQKAVEVVSKAIPGWSEKLQKEITEHALSEGYTNQELSSIRDPRHIKTLWKAREYDRLKSAAKAVPAKIAVVKTGASNPMPQQTKDKFAFQKSMSKASTATQKARLIEEKLTREFSR